MPIHRRFWHLRVGPLMLAAWTCLSGAGAAPGQTRVAANQTVAAGEHSQNPPVIDDPAFAHVPFDQWLADGDQGKFRWIVRVSAAELSNHQRLKARVEMQVDGSDVVNRRGHGYLVMLVQFEDAEHRIYRSHGALDLEPVNEAAAKSDVIYTQEAFLRPGDYRIALVIFDAKTGEHSAVERKIHAGPLRNDPFPAAWDHLPAVEFPGVGDAPDSWYLPDVTGRLNLPLETRRPVHIELLVNASPTAMGAGARTGQVNHRSMIDLLPALKVISQVAVRDGTLHVSLLDLTRQSVIFEQDNTGTLDWPPLRAALVTADPNKIDAKSLGRRDRNAQFFVEQVRQRLDPVGGGSKSAEASKPGDAAKSTEDPLRVEIVLSGPMTLESHEGLHPIEAAPGSKLFYIRYHALPIQQPIQQMYADSLRGGRRGFPGMTPPAVPLVQEPLDALESLVKPLQPHLFDVYTPEQFRKALSTVLDEISRM